MKKIILLSLLLLPLAVIAEDVDNYMGVEEPQWKDFTPKAYVEVPPPKGLARFNDTASYWYKRRVEFEQGIEQCRAMQDTESKISCYQDLKIKQYQKNSDYNARLEAIEKSKMMPQAMMNPTDNMLPIGGFNPLGGFGTMMHFQDNELR